MIINCIVSVHYKDSGFQLDPCSTHRKKRNDNIDEKNFEYRIELNLKEEQIEKNEHDDENKFGDNHFQTENSAIPDMRLNLLILCIVTTIKSFL